MLGGRGRAEAEVVLIHTEGSRKNRNSPDPQEGQSGDKQKWFQSAFMDVWGATRQKWSGSVFGIRDKSRFWLGMERGRGRGGGWG